MRTILVVDDSPTALFDIIDKLQDITPDAKALSATNYEEAKHILDSNSIDIAIIDLQMPVKNGADLIVYMKSVDHMKEIPIIVLTATGEDSLLRTSIEPKVNHYLSKPVGQAKLESIIKELINE